MILRLYSNWKRHRASDLAAVIAFYSIFSIAPLLLLILSIGSFVFDEGRLRGDLLDRIGEIAGREASRAAEEIISEDKVNAGVAGALGIVILAYGASKILEKIKFALNTIFDARELPEPSWTSWILSRITAIVTVILFELALIAFLTVSAKVTGTFKILNVPVTFAAMMVFAAALYGILPNTRCPKKYVWLGAVVTATFMTVGISLVGLYLSQAAPQSAFGAAGSFVLLLIWIYYSAQIFLLGAEFTKALAGD